MAECKPMEVASTNNNGVLADDSGKRSNMRIVNAVIVFTIMLVWAVACFHGKKFLPFHSSHIYLIGVALFGKLVQKGLEKDSFGILKGK